MPLTTLVDFPCAELPTPLAAPGIDLWFFDAWPAPRQAAESEAVQAVLARYVASPLPLRVVRAEGGKPRLVDAAIEFNVSHTGNAALIGVGDVALGVDLERCGRTRPVLELARRFFAAPEAIALEALDAAQRPASFLDLWCCKEAVLKALGRGLAFGLERVVFGLDREGRVSQALQIAENPISEWHVVRLQPAPGFVGALAWRGAARDVRVCRTPPAV